MSLIALQRDFRAALLADSSDGARPGFLVYHHAYRVQLIDCLRETFPQLRKWLGDDEFTEAALAHIERVPPSSWTLGAYGDNFDVTVAALYPEDDEVAELAWLEWSLSCAFASRNAKPVAADELRDVHWDRACIGFVPTLHQGGIRTNVAAIWSALSENEEPPSAEYLPHSASAIVWRQGFSPRFRMIDEEEREALAAMQIGATFAELCSAIVSRLGEREGVQTAGRYLGQWLQDGLVVSVDERKTPLGVGN